MSKKCFKLNPLQRDGTNQNQRLVEALHPSYISVDEREMDDLLIYARKFSQIIRFYNSSNQQDGNWQVFIEKDISTLIAVILNKDLEVLKSDFDLAYITTTGNNIPDKKQGIGKQFKILFLAFAEIDHWYQNAVDGLALKTSLKVKIQSVLNEALRNTISLCRIFKEGTGMDFYYADNAVFDEIWNTQNIEDISLIDDPTALDTDPDALNEVATELKKLFEKIFRELHDLQDDAPAFLEETLNDYPEHQPYMALFLTFISLFMHARDHINTITRRHLDFYYRDVLHLESKPEQPDSVHHIFELAKAFQTHLIQKGTLLKDGKDSLGAEILFASNDELVVNKAKIDEATAFKSIFIKKNYQNQNPNSETPFIIQNIYAAAKANSADGIDADIEDADGKWQTFGNENIPYAKIGFAVASPILLLAEGQRTITFTFDFDDPKNKIFKHSSYTINQITCELKNNIKVYLSGKEGWVTGEIIEVEIKTISENSGQYIFKVEPGPGAPSIVNFDNKVLGDGFETKYPVAKFILDNDGLDASQLQGSFVPLNSIDEIGTLNEVLVNRALQFINNANTAEDIAGSEPEIGPVVDNPETGYGDQIDDYDIGIRVAKRIIEAGNFSSLRELMAIKGFGIDKLNDLLYSTDCADVAKIRSNAENYKPETKYKIGDYVFYGDELFRCRVGGLKAYRPDKNPAQWKHIGKSYPYKYFRPLELTKLKLQVEVSGLKNIIVENDVGKLNAAKPFMPFGPVPAIGSSFYIGSHEIFKKYLAGPNAYELKIDLKWTNLPDSSFSDHYTNYQYKSDGAFTKYFTGNNDSFKADIEILHEGEWNPLSPNQKLFNTVGGILKPEKTYEINNLISDRNPSQKPFDAYGFGFERGFIRFKLNQHFFHKYFAEVLTNAALNPDTLGVPREPYTPLISEISLGYTSSQEIDFTSLSKSDFENRVEQLFHIQPFGINEFFAIGEAPDKNVFTSKMLVPGFLVSEKDETTGEIILDSKGNNVLTDAEGSLFIGIENLEPEQNLPILFQVAEGSENPEKEKQEVIWSYLSYNNWIDFDHTEIISDDTNGLLRSGIIKFTMPKTMGKENTLLPSGKHWIKASLARGSDAVCKVIAILPQAVKSTFLKSETNDLDRLSEPLAEGLVNKLKTGRAEIKKVLQPFASFGGQAQEMPALPDDADETNTLGKENNAYYIRVSERLRHKGRGITIFDYERLVLQQFPEVYKVKCVNHTSDESEHAPGNVTVVVIPDLRNKNAVDPLEPRLSLNKLEEIKAFLQPLISDFINLEVRNPAYEKVKVSFNVQFLPGKDKGFYTNKLQDDIQRFLTPWLFDEGKDLILGGSVHRSAVLNFIEETDYVDFLTEFKMFHTDAYGSTKEVEEAKASSSSSALVSGSEHVINFDIDVSCLK